MQRTRGLLWLMAGALAGLLGCAAARAEVIDLRFDIGEGERLSYASDTDGRRFVLVEGDRSPAALARRMHTVDPVTAGLVLLCDVPGPVRVGARWTRAIARTPTGAGSLDMRGAFRLRRVQDALVVQGTLDYDVTPVAEHPFDSPDGSPALRLQWSGRLEVEALWDRAARRFERIGLRHKRGPTSAKGRMDAMPAFAVQEVTLSLGGSASVSVAIDEEISVARGRLLELLEARNERGPRPRDADDGGHAPDGVLLLAALRAGATPEHPVIAAALRRTVLWVDGGAATDHRTFTWATAILALEATAWSRRPGRDPRDPAYDPRPLDPIHRRAIEVLTGKLLAAGTAAGWSPGIDHPCASKLADPWHTQVALSALFAARHAGVPIDRERLLGWRALYARTLESVRGSYPLRVEGVGVRLESQVSPAGWGYDQRLPDPIPMTTAGGIASLLICGRLAGVAPRALGAGDPAVRGLGCLAGLYAQDDPSGRRRGLGIALGTAETLWAMEQALELAGVDAIDGHDWYRDGALWIMESVFIRHGPPSDLALATLFLTRATRAYGPRD